MSFICRKKKNLKLKMLLEFYLPIRSSLSRATVSKARLIIGYSSSTSLKLSTDREYRRQYVSARTLAVLLPRVSKQISATKHSRRETAVKWLKSFFEIKLKFLNVHYSTMRQIFVSEANKLIIVTKMLTGDV